MMKPRLKRPDKSRVTRRCANEATWFLTRLGADKSVSLAERALIDFLKVEAPGFAQGLAVAA